MKSFLDSEYEINFLLHLDLNYSLFLEYVIMELKTLYFAVQNISYLFLS